MISFLQRQRVEKKIVKVNQTMSFGQVIPKWVETISNLKRHIYSKCEQVASYNKQKNELKTGEALIHVDYSESNINPLMSGGKKKVKKYVWPFCYHQALKG